MYPYVDAHSLNPIRRPLAEPLRNVLEGGGLPRRHALPRIRELAGVLSTTPNTVARAIEDLKRSGYRPLHSTLAAPEPSSIRGTPPATERHAGDGEADVMRGSHTPVQEDVS